MESETYRNGNVGVGEDNYPRESILSDRRALPHPDLFLDFGKNKWFDNHERFWGGMSKAKTLSRRRKRGLGIFLERMKEAAKEGVKRIHCEGAHLRQQETSKSQPFLVEELQEIDRSAKELGLEIIVLDENETPKARVYAGLRKKREQTPEEKKNESGWADAMAWEKYLPYAKTEWEKSFPHEKFPLRRWKCPTQSSITTFNSLSDARDLARFYLNHYQRNQYSTTSEHGWRIEAARHLRDTLDLTPLEREIVGTDFGLMAIYEATHDQEGDPRRWSAKSLERMIGNHKPARRSKIRGMLYHRKTGRISTLRKKGYKVKDLRSALSSVSKKFNFGGKGEDIFPRESILSDIPALPAPRRKPKPKTQKEPVNA